MFPHGSYLLQVTWQNRERWIDGLQVKHVDAMDDESTWSPSRAHSQLEE